ncbi:hypothetical protein GWI33_023066 [Rhynchophorus ferrugineus]|uniref:Transposase n=1 Tax=Rhynchophorus ferrugineus TaxID=354439 RepID=A0A834HPF4_RHYFE|nr:hypothetical protein GWI33_023067 [Rhynchophorus ferrugineus]KAF7264548.1 hypothetical protein GWI33_023066 [Rhynchophorus ferrugineus]
MDETWLRHFTPKSNRQSSERTAHDEPAPKRGKMQQSAGKVVVSVFWDAHGIIFIGYLEKEGPSTATITWRLKDEIAEKRPQLKKKKLLLHQDNAPCHKSQVKTMAKIHELGFELLLHPPYYPDVAPSDYLLFLDLKIITEAYFKTKDKSYYKNGIKKLEGRYNQRITLEGNFVE